MPKGDRGSRGRSKGRPNYVRLKIKVEAAPPGMTKDKLRDKLKESILFGHQPLEEGLKVLIGWSNHRDGDLKWDEFNKANIESSQNSRGWDALVLNYLDRN